ncbi:MAG: flagellar protein FlgN [Desulfobacterales bacterium]
MKKKLGELIDTIERQSACYLEMMDLFQAERDAIVKSDIERLNAVIQEKESRLEAIRDIELDRLRRVEVLAETLGCPPGGLTLRRLAGMVDEPHASELRQLSRRCKTLFDRVATESATSRSLCLHALAFVNGSLRLLGQLAGNGTVYRSSGQVHLQSASGRVLSGAY